MPAKTERQRRFMAMCAHNPSAAKAKCPPMAIAQEFAAKRHNNSGPRAGNLYTHKRRHNIA